MSAEFVEFRFKTMASVLQVRSEMSRLFYTLVHLESSNGCRARNVAEARQWAIGHQMGLEWVKMCDPTRECTVRFSRPGKPEDEGYDKEELARSLAAFAANPPVLDPKTQGKCVVSSHYGLD